MRCILNQFVP